MITAEECNGKSNDESKENGVMEFYLLNNFIVSDLFFQVHLNSQNSGSIWMVPHLR